MVLNDRIDTECQEMKDTGRMKRWTPLRDQQDVRAHLMEVLRSAVEVYD